MENDFPICQLPFLGKVFIFLQKSCKVSLEQFLTCPRFGKEHGRSHRGVNGYCRFIGVRKGVCRVERRAGGCRLSLLLSTKPYVSSEESILQLRSEEIEKDQESFG